MGVVRETLSSLRRYSAPKGAENAKSDYNIDEGARKRRARRNAARGIRLLSHGFRTDSSFPETMNARLHFFIPRR